MDWHDRNLIGMAVHRASGGDPEAFNAWCEWLQRSGRFDFESAKRQWAHYGKYLGNHHAKPIGLGTLLFFAKRIDPEWRDRLEVVRW
jgi:hypothetical protein